MKTIPAARRASVHMAQALPDNLPRRRYRWEPTLWRLWMTLATLTILSAVVAVIIIKVLRYGL